MHCNQMPEGRREGEKREESFWHTCVSILKSCAQSPTDFRVSRASGLYLVTPSTVSGLSSGAKSEMQCVYEVDGFPQCTRLLFAYGRRTGIDGSATDVREDLLYVL